MDYLMRAIEAHNTRARSGEADAPGHLVVLKAMSGASAGSVTLAAALAAMIDRQTKQGNTDLTPTTSRPYRDHEGEEAEYGISLPQLHEIWVDRLGLWQEMPDGSMDGLLSLADLENGDGLNSILDSGFIDRVADTALQGVRWEPGTSAPFTCVAADLDLFLVTTSLSSVPYAVEFVTGNSNEPGGQFRMANHRAVRHFRVHGLGEKMLPSPWLDAWADEGISLTPPDDPDLTLFESGLRGWDALRIGAVASGAFPIGLAARLIPAEAEEFGQIVRGDKADGGARTLNIDPAKVRVALPDFGDEAEPNMPVRYFAVDGGVLNNEPLEYARFAIRGPSDTHPRLLRDNPRHPAEADRAVILIDPFPEGPEYKPLVDGGSGRFGVFWTIMELFPALINQARFKPSEIINAADPEISSRFIIRPARRTHDGTLHIGKDAIASGSLNGFGGFMDHDLRRHDFVLGQRNCQEFLEREFCVSSDNMVAGRTGADGPVPIIDPGATCKDPIIAAAWPRLEHHRLLELLEQIRKRLRAIGVPLLRDTGLSGPLLFLFGCAWLVRWPLRGLGLRIENLLVSRVLSELLSHDAISDIGELPPPEREVLQTLLKEKGRVSTVNSLIGNVETSDQDQKEERGAMIESLANQGILRRVPRLLGSALVGFAPEEPGTLRKIAIFFRIPASG